MATEQVSSTSNSPVSPKTPQTPRSSVEFQTLPNVLVDGQKRQQQTLDTLVSEVAAVKSSKQAVNSKIDRISSQVINRVNAANNAINDNVNEVYALVRDVPVKILEIHDAVENLNSIKKSVDNIKIEMDALYNGGKTTERIKRIEVDNKEIVRECVKALGTRVSQQVKDRKEIPRNVFRPRW